MTEGMEGAHRLEQRITALEAAVARHEASLAVVSDVVRFGPLRQLLTAQHFDEADRETARLLFDWIGISAEQITPEAIELFPITPLQIVDRLWREASGGRLGFSVQLGIYQDLGGNLDTLIAQDTELFRAFCTRVGWDSDGLLRDPDATGSTEIDAARSDAPAAPELLPLGALPHRWWVTPYGMKIANGILARLISGGFRTAAPQGDGASAIRPGSCPAAEAPAGAAATSG